MEKRQLAQKARNLARQGRTKLQKSMKTANLTESQAYEELAAICPELEGFAEILANGGALDGEQVIRTGKRVVNFNFGLGEYLKFKGEKHEQLFHDSLQFGRAVMEFLSQCREYVAKGPKPPGRGRGRG